MNALTLDKHVTDLLPAYTLNALDTEEALEVSRHVEMCDKCYGELLAYRHLADRIALGAPGASAPPELKTRLMAHIHAAAARVRRTPVLLWGKRLPLVPRFTVVVWSVAAVVAIIALTAINVVQWEQANQAVTTSVEAGLKTIRLKGTELAPLAKGMLVISSDGKHGLLFVDGLPVLEARRVYQAWLGEAEAPFSAGLIDLQDRGYGWLEVSSDDRELVDYPSLRITIEPAGGSPNPTGKAVLLGGSE